MTVPRQARLPIHLPPEWLRPRRVSRADTDRQPTAERDGRYALRDCLRLPSTLSVGGFQTPAAPRAWLRFAGPLLAQASEAIHMARRTSGHARFFPSRLQQRLLGQPHEDGIERSRLQSCLAGKVITVAPLGWTLE